MQPPTTRTPASRRLVPQVLVRPPSPASSGEQSTTTTTMPMLAVLRPPSCRREEQEALRNLRRRLQAARVVQANCKPDPPPLQDTAAVANNNDRLREEVDNKNHLLQRILLQRPVSMVLEAADLVTAWKDSDFITDCLCWHNVYRQRHGSPPLVMSSELCHLAQTWANHLAHTNRFYYRNDRDIGQNLFCRPQQAIVSDITGQEVASHWYSAVKQYEYQREPDRLHANVNAGHFTQLIWASSRYFGVGKARSRSGKVVVVAHYSPAGNLPGSHTNNVFPPLANECGLGPRPRLPVPRVYGGSTASESSQGTSSST